MTKRLLINGFIFNQICDVVAMEVSQMNTDMSVYTIIIKQLLLYRIYNFL